MKIWPRLLSLADSMASRGMIAVERRSVDELIERARRSTGLSDLGSSEGEAALRKNLNRVIEDVWLSEISATMKRVFQEVECVGQISRRLSIVHERTRHPEIASTAIPRPIWIVGSWRTGSTLLHQLMAQDPRARSIRRWEMLSPTPSPRPETHRRIWGDTLSIRLLSPDLHRIHSYDADQAEECCAMWITGLLPVASIHLPGTERSLKHYLDERNTLVDTYREQRDVMQVLCFRHPVDSHIVLKCPLHTYKLETIAHVFEDSTFVWLHRDVAEVLPSLCALITAIRQPFLPAGSTVDPLKVGARARLLVRRMFEVGLAQRERLEQRGVRFVDLSYSDLTGDPPQAMSTLYRDLGLDYGEQQDRGVRRFLREQKRHDRMRLPIDHYGLNRAEVHSEFAEYSRRFGIMQPAGSLDAVAQR